MSDAPFYSGSVSVTKFNGRNSIVENNDERPLEISPRCLSDERGEEKHCLDFLSDSQLFSLLFFQLRIFSFAAFAPRRITPSALAGFLGFLTLKLFHRRICQNELENNYCRNF